MNIAFVGSQHRDAVASVQDLSERYGQCDPMRADYVVAVGGHGTALRALHAVLAPRSTPVFVMRQNGTKGPLFNSVHPDDLERRLTNATPYSFHPLRVRGQTVAGGEETVLSIHDMSLIRQTRRAASLVVMIDGKPHSPALLGDGIVVATPLGSAGYNLSAGGPILPFHASLLAVTGIARHTDHSWRNIAVDDTSLIDVEVIHPLTRPVRLETDLRIVHDIARVRISVARDYVGTLLFDDGSVAHYPSMGIS